MTSVDLTVMGGGIFGLCCAYEAASRGARVRLFEKEMIGAGSSGGIVGALAPHVPENWNVKKQFQLESLLMAAPFWAGVEKISNLPTGYGRLGRLQSLPNNPALLERAMTRATNAVKLWRGQACWDVVTDLEDPQNWVPYSPSGMWIKDSLSARLHPRMALKALARAVCVMGGEVIECQGREPDHDIDSDGLTIWATGYDGLIMLNEAFSMNVGQGIKGQSFLLQYDASHAPQIYGDELHIIPHVDGTVAIGSTSEKTWENRCTTDAQLEGLRERVLRLCPFLETAEVIDRWAGVRPRTHTRAPILGPWPGRNGHFIANGGFKIGFGMAPKVAKVMVDLALEGQNLIPEGFRVRDAL